MNTTKKIRPKKAPNLRKISRRQVAALLIDWTWAGSVGRNAAHDAERQAPQEMRDRFSSISRKRNGGTHAWINAKPAAADLEPGRLCRDLARGNRDRFARSGRPHAPVQLRAGRGACQARRKRPRRPRRRPRRSRRDAGLEFMAASRTLLRSDLLPPPPASGQTSAVRRTTPLRHQPRRKRRRCLPSL